MGSGWPVGFLIPHRADLTAKTLGKFVLPVRTIEQIPGINFIPDHGKNDALETKVEERWFRETHATPTAFESPKRG